MNKLYQIKREPTPMQRFHTHTTKQRRARIAIAAVIAIAVLAGAASIARAEDSVSITAAKIEAHEQATWRAVAAMPVPDDAIGRAGRQLDVEEMARNARIADFSKLADSLAFGAFVETLMPVTPEILKQWADYSRTVRAAEDREALANWPQYSGSFDTVFHDTTVRN